MLFVYDKTRLFKKVYGEKVDYFDRLGTLDRKRWLALETYLRNELKFSLLDDKAITKLSKPQKGNKNSSIDPPNYNILSNWVYQKNLGFKLPHL